MNLESNRNRATQQRWRCLQLARMLSSPGLLLFLLCVLSSFSPASTVAADSPTPPSSSQTQRLLLERIEVEPNRRENRNLVLRELTVRSGDRVGPEELVAVREELTASNWFSEVEVYTKKGAAPGAVVLVIETKLDRQIQLETGVGHEELSGWYLNLLGVRAISLFHRGGTASIGYREGLQTAGFYADLLVPGLIAGSDFLVDLAEFDRKWIASVGDTEYSQSIDHLEGLVGLRRRSLGGTSLLGEVTLWLGATSFHPSDSLDSMTDLDDALPRDIIPESFRYRSYWETRLDWLHDRWDPQRSWQSGHWGAVRVRVADEFDGGAFWSATGDVRVARPLANGSATAFRFRTGWTGPGTPYHQRFAVGGVRSVRGYSFAELSGPRGASATWHSSFEWRQPLAGVDARRPRILGTVFFDAGDVWDSHGERVGLSAGVGYGVSIRIPWVQVLTAEVGYPLQRDRSKSDVSIYLTLGGSF